MIDFTQSLSFSNFTALKTTIAMKNHLLFSAIGVVTALTPATAQAQEGACDNLNAIVDAAQEYFGSIRGDETSFEIRGVSKPYQLSNVTITEGVKTYITADEWYPEAVAYTAKTRFYSETLQNEYDRLKQLVADCLGEDWVFVEKDKNNDIYLEDTDYKKAVFSENKKGKKVKVQIFMYNQRELDSWCVEFKVFGIGKQL